jgi:uncharacterized damage-inducible protein DinB
MITVSYCQMMARYNVWMNDRLYQLCEGLDDTERKQERGAFFGSIHGTLDHILYGDLAAMVRFTGEPAEMPVLGQWLHEDFTILRAARKALDQRLTSWSSDLSDDWMAATMTYTSQADGLSRTVPRWVMVVHMFNHQTHHRGQLTTLLSQLSLDIGTTDLPFLPEFTSTH